MWTVERIEQKIYLVTFNNTITLSDMHMARLNLVQSVLENRDIMPIVVYNIMEDVPVPIGKVTEIKLFFEGEIQTACRIFNFSKMTQQLWFTIYLKLGRQFLPADLYYANGMDNAVGMAKRFKSGDTRPNHRILD